VGYFLASRLRRLLQNPARLLSPYVKRDMTVLDVGCAMGFFSLPLAEMVQPQGKVVCVDVQQRMLEVLAKRAARAGLAGFVETHLCDENTLGLKGRDETFDFALAFAVMHELSDPPGYLGDMHRLLKPGAHLLLAEPAAHVDGHEFERTVRRATQAGFVVIDRPHIRMSRAVVLKRNAAADA
jgi:ubiquinone/menaquinone biosynthesis C-methylase UbiE